MPEPDRDPIRWLDAELGRASLPHRHIYDLDDDDDDLDDPYWRYREYLSDNGLGEIQHQYREALQRGAVDLLPPDVTLEQAVEYVVALHHPDHEIAAWEELRVALEALGPGATIRDLAAAGKLPKRTGPRPFSIDGYRAANGVSA